MISRKVSWGHILRRFIGIGGQPGFHQTDAAGKTERIGIFQVFNSVRKSPAQYVKTVGGNQIFNAMDKRDIPVWPQQGAADIFVFCRILKNILNKRKAGFVKGTDRMILNGLADLFQQFSSQWWKAY